MAEICHVPTAQPDAPTSPTITSIPMPGPTIPSLLRAVMALKQAVEELQKPPQVFTGGHTKKPAEDSWVEVSRKTEKVRITNPKDKNQYVDVERINELVMGDKKTKQTWRWRRQRGTAPK